VEIFEMKSNFEMVTWPIPGNEAAGAARPVWGTVPHQIVGVGI